MTRQSDVGDMTTQALESAADRLRKRGFSTHVYVITPDESDAFTPITGVHAPVFCLDIRLGAASRLPGYSTHALYRVFDPQHPNVGIMFDADIEDSTGRPYNDHRRPRFTPRLDRAVTWYAQQDLIGTLAPLDPTGQGRAVNVWICHGEAALIAWPQLFYSFYQCLTFLRICDPQVAIWADHPSAAVNAFGWATRLLARGRIHMYGRTSTPSQLRNPVRLKNGEVVHFTDFSTALDRAIHTARGALGAG